MKQRKQEKVRTGFFCLLLLLSSLFSLLFSLSFFFATKIIITLWCVNNKK